MCVYIPPDGSISYATDDCNGIETLKSKMLEISSSYPNDLFCLFEDFNSRTGQRQDFINDGFQNVPIMDWYTEDPFSSHRCSKDRVVDTFGPSLLDMCMELNVHIENGRAKGDERGEYTLMIQNGHSVIDYFIMSTPMFDWIENFAVLRYDVGYHLPVECELKWCAYCSCQDNSDSELQIITLHEYHRCKWNSENNAIFRNNLNEENIIESLNEISSMCATQKKANDIVSKLNSLLSDAARHMIYNCGGNCKKKTFQAATQPGWWDKECKQTKAAKNALLNRYRKIDADDDLDNYLQA